MNSAMSQQRSYFKFFRGVKVQPRQFEYKPRLYDEEKEEWEKRVKRIEQEVAIERGEEVEYEKGLYDFKSGWKRGAYRARVKRGSNIMLLVILVMLIGGAYLALKWLETFEV